MKQGPYSPVALHIQGFRQSSVSSSWSLWPRGLRLRSVAALLLRLWVRIPSGAWMCVCCEFCVLSGRGLCDELITRPEESYWMWCFVLCDLENSWMRTPWSTGGYCAKREKDELCGLTHYSLHREILQLTNSQDCRLLLYSLNKVERTRQAIYA